MKMLKNWLGIPKLSNQVRLKHRKVVIGTAVKKIDDGVLIRQKFTPGSDLLFYRLGYVEFIPENESIPWLW